MFPYLAVCLLIVATAAAMGSFFHATASRLPLMRNGRQEQGRPITLSHPNSRCPACQNPIPWHYNVPGIGWLILKGKCHHCRVKIPAIYPLSEVAGGLMALLVLWRLGVNTAGIAGVAMALSLYAPTLLLWKGPVAGRRTHTTLSMLLGVPLLVSTAPWWLSAPSLQDAPALSLDSVVAVMLALFTLAAWERRQRRMTLFDAPLIVGALLLLSLPAAISTLLAARLIASRSRGNKHQEPVMGIAIASASLFMVMASLTCDIVARALLSSAWSGFLYTM